MARSSSTKDQYDAFGPDSQREHQDRAISQFGMTDTGIEWMVAASGWKDVWTTRAFSDMLDRAGGDFDVLVVPYFSRFMRNIKQALVFRDEIHARGAVVYICDERILSSDEHGWDEWVREAHAAEAFRRKQSRRVGEGYAAKRRRLGVPGGNRPPFGYMRVRSDPANPRFPQQLIEDPENAPVVRRAFELSASGMTDREVAVAVGLKLKHVRELLKNPVYFGRLRTGEDSGGPPLVTRALWDTVAVVRGKYSRRHRGPVSRRTYALSTLLICAACGRRLTGHVGRYRHVDVCAEFKAAKPTVVPWRSPGDRRLKGESYKTEVYDNLVPQLLSRVSVGAKTMTQVVDGLAAPPSSTFTMARIERDREVALRKYKQDRDTTALERTMKRLDDEEREAQAATQVISAEEAVAWLQDLPALWSAADDSGRRLLTEALFEKVEVLGVKSVVIHPTPEADAHGWSEAFGSMPQLIPVEMVAGAIGTDGRGERASADTPSPSLVIPVANVPSYGYREVPGRMGPRSGRCSAGTHRPSRPLRLASEGRSEAPTVERARGHRLQDEAVAGRARDADPAGSPASSPRRTVRPGPTRQ